MLDHMHPQKPARKDIDGRRRRDQQGQQRDREKEATPEPYAPLIYASSAGKRRNPGPGSFPCSRIPDNPLPTTEVHHFGDKAGKQYLWWNWPPIGINPDTHNGISI